MGAVEVELRAQGRGGCVSGEVDGRARGTRPPQWETGRVNDENRPSGGKTLGLILLAMIAILAVIIALSLWASKTG
ncbi:hypothetical protein GCM10009850_082790 [Nonomuraea monospora]|uniref:Uncharacterized protein n=1 Tax=Nonomuraea monospora TaxID=568818 RepID=A0ABN3CTN8_9ACTN